MIGASIHSRRALPFRAVNRSGIASYDPGLQRHHLLPRQLLSQRCFGQLIAAVGGDGVGFDDFRSNGMLLPASEAAALRLGLPLHRGPHRDYNRLVSERVGQIEAGWAATRGRTPEIAAHDAHQRLVLLQRALRRRLLAVARRPFALNRRDPFGREVNFAELDAMADALWPVTELSG